MRSFSNRSLFRQCRDLGTKTGPGSLSGSTAITVASSSSSSSRRSLITVTERPTLLLPGQPGNKRLFATGEDLSHHLQQVKSPDVATVGRKPLTRCVIEMTRKGQRPGSLNKTLDIFQRYDVNLTHIESRLLCFAYDGLCFHLDFEGRETDERVQACLKEVGQLKDCSKVEIIAPTDVPWFPTNLKELDHCVTETIDGGESGGLINPDHPGFNDPEYRKRRDYITEVANSFRYGKEMQDVGIVEFLVLVIQSLHAYWNSFTMK